MSAEKKVITIKGEELPISQCRKFNKLYYKIGDVNVENSGDCYLIAGKCYRLETGLVIYNHTIKQYVLGDENLVKGVVGIEGDSLIMGYFEYSKKYPKIITQSGEFLLFDTNIFKNKIYRELLSTGDYYHISRIPANEFDKIIRPSKDYKYSLPYDSKGIMEHHLKGYNNYNPEILKNIKNYAPLLGGLSFGLEFETTKGYIPNRILDQYGLIPLRDGSISGIEYVTVPMEGEKGLQCTVDILKVLKERTEYNDDTCSLHLHLGNVPRTKEFILAFFILGMKIQDEMFQMFPLYKKYNYGLKNKNYSAPLPTFEILSQLDSSIDSKNIDKNFGVLYKYLSMGQDFKTLDNNLDNVSFHPADPNGNQKWNCNTRYLLYNVTPLLFGNKQTIECRIHTPTYSINKILPFIFMNTLLVNFTIKNTNNILENPSFLKDFELFTILKYQMYMYNVNGLKTFENTMYKYIKNRITSYERQTFKGNILGRESEISDTSGIEWLAKNKPFSIPQGVDYDWHKMEHLLNISEPMTRRKNYSSIIDSISVLNHPFNISINTDDYSKDKTNVFDKSIDYVDYDNNISDQV